MRRGKKTILVIAAVSMVLGLCIPALAFSGAGSGTQADPYVITDINELQEMNDDLTAYYVLGNDIDASETSSWNNGAGFTPIGYNPDLFTGTFDGQGYVIAGLHINRPSTADVGLFGYIEQAKIRNVGLADADVTGLGGVGTLVGSSESSTIFRVWASGTATGTHSIQSPLGGLIGWTGGVGGFVSQCYSSVNVFAISSSSPANRTGGLVGLNTRGSIIVDCYATGNVAAKNKVGGLVGDNVLYSEYGGYIARCYSTGHVTGNGGGLIGYNYRGGKTYDSYWDKQTSGKSTSHGGTPKTTAEMMQQATFVNWDFVNIWSIIENVSYPFFGEPALLDGLEIRGPNEVAEDFSAQYKAIAHYDNGGTADVTGLAEWSVDDETIASINAGLLTTEAINMPQDIIITAEYTEGEVAVEAEKDVSIFAICPSGSALDFDGVDDYVEVNDDSSLRFSCSDSFSISFWVKLFDDGFILSKMRTSQRRGVFGYQIRWEPSRFSFNLESSFVKNVNLFTPENSAPAGSWYYVATVYDNRDMKIYLNGKLANSGTFDLDTGSTIPDKNLAIGARSYDSTITRYLNGQIDEVAIYNRALSAEEIVASMHTKLTGDEDGLVAYWDFDEGEGQVAGDLSVYGNDGTLGSEPVEDSSDPAWVDSDALIGICSLEGIVERNLLNILGMKNDVLDILDEAIGKEEALWEYMDIVFKDRNFGNTGKGDVVKAKQKIHSAIQEEEQAESTVERSIDKLEDALDALDIE